CRKYAGCVGDNRAMSSAANRDEAAPEAEGEQRVEGQRVGERPVDEQGAGERRADEQGADEQSAGEQGVGEQGAGERRAGERRTGERRIGDGERGIGDGERTLSSRDPATGGVLGEVRATRPERIDEVVAGVAKVQPLWALLRVQDRARYMRRMAQAIIDE